MGVICEKCLNRKQLQEEKVKDKSELTFPELKSSMDEFFKKVEKFKNFIKFMLKKRDFT